MRTVITTILVSVSIMVMGQKNFHQFEVKDIDGNTVKMSDYKGKKILVVNVASKCGLTPQYSELQELYNLYKDSNFVIIAFPANNFLGQEPGSDEEIKEFCTKNYDVTFPVMSKISVKGKDIHPVYEWLTMKKNNKLTDAPVQWNFQKFLIDEKGDFAGFFGPKESPTSENIVNWIKSK
jgi:glutathione peroxidase